MKTAKQKKERNRSVSGFTLIEVAVTSAILVFLMSIIWSSGSIRTSDFSIMVNQEKLRTLMTRAKSLTINSVFGGSDVCGYGVRIEENQAFIFLDKGACGSGNNRRYDSGERVAGSSNEITLREGIKFTPSTGGSAEVLFIPPDPDVIINANDATQNLYVEVSAPESAPRRVIINKQGLIGLES